MSDEIKVYVVAYPGRRNLVMRYKDPVTDRLVAKTAGTSKRKDAEREAAKWEQDLRAGRYQPKGKTTWGEFRERYETEAMRALADRTAEKAGNVLDVFERSLSIGDDTRLSEVATADRLSAYAAKLREGVEKPHRGGAKGKVIQRSESTIAGHMAYLQAAFRWAAELGLLTKAPTVAKTKRAKRTKRSTPMKGRPITAEEFDRMLDKVPDVVGEQAAGSWRHYLEGLWWSGLRLEESLDLYWDREDKLHLMMDGPRPVMRIHAELEKGHEDRLLPMAPEFALFAAETPKGERRGRVFRPQARDGRPLARGRISRVVSAIGKAAGVKVNTDPRSGQVKYASAHDLRRSFGERWASRVMPQVLQELMRHESIDTTLRYYVGRNAHNVAETLWAAFEVSRSKLGSDFGNTEAKEATAEAQQKSR